MQTADYVFQGYKAMGLLLSLTHLQDENNSPQLSAFYTDR